MNLSSPFIHQALTTNKVMLLVIIALIPGATLLVHFFGYGVLINLIFCGSFAIVTEYCLLKIRKRPALETIKDNSALLTGLLIALSIPPTLPIWMAFIGVAFAIIFGKQLYGGLGLNPFNPAMVGYVLLLISFPVEMTSWLPPFELTASPASFLEALELILFSKTSTGLTVNDFRLLADGYTMATPLDFVKTELLQGKMTSEIFNPAPTNQLLTNLSAFQSSLTSWLWINTGFFIGGLFLLANKTIRWHIPVSLLSGMIITSQILHWFDRDLYSHSWFHLTSGATMLGAFFIATDPVTASTTPKGRIIYGLSIGFFVVIIRTFGGYPEAMAFSVLLLNLAAPTIDHYTNPKIYGHQKEGGL